MTREQITAAVTAIRARHTAEVVEGSVPVTEPWAPFPTVALLPNPCADRGHDMRGDDFCQACDDILPVGGWDAACPNDRRVFQGG
jgi:hypothetical protein